MFIKAKKKREELRLPILHYIVADDWMDKLGPKAFTAWLKFHTWVNRQDERIDDISQAKIPMSMDKVAEKLGMNKSTLYRNIIPVLWEYGLIDLVEYDGSNRKTQKPVNIIPYDYPQNDKSLETKPLEKCRDWIKDYNTIATFYARKRKEKVDIEPKIDGCKNATVDGCKNERVTRSKMQPNNYSNNSINDSNNLLMDEEEKPLEETKLYQFLIERNIDSLVAKSMIELTKQNEIDLYAYEVTEQLKQMYYETVVEGKVITDYPVYFLNGIIMQRQQRKTKKQHKDLERIQAERMKKKLQQPPETQKPIYKWLED
jgi:predicted transcriptional regulator